MKPIVIKTSVYIGALLLSTGISYFIFGRFLSAASQTPQKPVSEVPTTVPGKQTGHLIFEGPVTEVCPINGKLYTQAEKDIWSTRRPLLVMIENHADARPQSGLQNADLVYEAVAEGGITRFMAVYYCGAVKGASNKYDVGPVRSARSYFLDIASEYADYPLYAHVGGANCSAPKDPVTGKSFACTTDKKAQAIEQISDYGWNNKGTWGDLSQFSLSYKVCRREPERTGGIKETEHTMYCSTKEFWNVAADRGLTNITTINNSSWDKSYRSWLFKQADLAVTDGQTDSISFNFWPGYKDYSVTWRYNRSANEYLRTNGSLAHVDFNTQETLTTKNLIVQFVDEKRSIDVHFHNLYKVIGSGKAILFQNGSQEEITWSKANRLSRTIYKDKAGKEVNFVPGMVWIELVPSGNEITYESQP